jgi:multidrug efflux pump subunit AcrB
VTAREVAEAVVAATGAFRFAVPGLDIPCELILGERKGGALKPEDLRGLKIRTPQGEMVPLNRLVSVQRTTAVGTILHCDGQRALLLEVDPAPGKAEAFRKALRGLAAEALPRGVRARLWTDDPAKKPEDISAR